MKTKHVTTEDPGGIVYLLDTCHLDYWIGLNLREKILPRLHLEHCCCLSCLGFTVTYICNIFSIMQHSCMHVIPIQVVVTL